MVTALPVPPPLGCCTRHRTALILPNSRRQRRTRWTARHTTHPTPRAWPTRSTRPSSRKVCVCWSSSLLRSPPCVASHRPRVFPVTHAISLSLTHASPFSWQHTCAHVVELTRAADAGYTEDEAAAFVAQLKEQGLVNFLREYLAPQPDGSVQSLRKLLLGMGMVPVRFLRLPGFAPCSHSSHIHVVLTRTLTATESA